jgi:uncharacterized membrane protein YfhO
VLHCFNVCASHGLSWYLESSPVSYAMSSCVQVMMYMRLLMTSLSGKSSIIYRARFGIGVSSMSSMSSSSSTLGHKIASNQVGCTGVVACLSWLDSRILLTMDSM